MEKAGQSRRARSRRGADEYGVVCCSGHFAQKSRQAKHPPHQPSGVAFDPHPPPMCTVLALELTAFGGAAQLGPSLAGPVGLGPLRGCMHTQQNRERNGCDFGQGNHAAPVEALHLILIDCGESKSCGAHGTTPAAPGRGSDSPSDSMKLVG